MKANSYIETVRSSTLLIIVRGDIITADKLEKRYLNRLKLEGCLSMIKTIHSMVLDDIEHGIDSLFIDFRRTVDDWGTVDEIEIPATIPYGIEYQKAPDENIIAFDIVNFPEFMKHIDEDKYLPDLGLFSYEKYHDLTLKELLKKADIID